MFYKYLILKKIHKKQKLCNKAFYLILLYLHPLFQKEIKLKNKSKGQNIYDKLLVEG